jgi:hypothetical protein
VAADFRAFATAGDNQSTSLSTLPIVVPATAAAGDYAALVVVTGNTSATLTTPAGWTKQSGGTVAGSSQSWRFSKTLVSGDVGATVNLVFSTSVRVQALMLVASGVNAAAQAGFLRSETTNTSTPTEATATGVPAGSIVLAFLARRASSPATLHHSSAFTEVGPIKTNYADSPEMAMVGGWFVTSTSGTVSGVGTSSPASVGTNYLVYLPPATVGGGGGSVTLATAQVTASAIPLTINAATATVGGEAWPPDPYRQAVRTGGVSYEFFFRASVGGAPTPGAQNLRPIGGQITDTTKPGVRRVLNVDLAPEPGVFDLLAPEGTTLTAICRATYQDRSSYDIPMGVFDVDSQSIEEGGGKISLTAPDLWVRIQRARFLVPQASEAGFPVVQQIAHLIQGAIPGIEVLITATSLATTPALVWERDRDKAIIDLATDIGAWVYFDRQGGAVIADIPQLGASADWLIDASATGVLVSLDRQRSRTETRNVVVVTSSASGGPAFDPVIVWDNESESPTYAGSNPLTNPGSAGPFGIAPAFFASAVLSSSSEAYQAGTAILSRTAGLAQQVSLSQVPNPALDAFQTVDVLRPKRQFEGTPGIERYVADTVTHPLSVDQPTHVDARTIRTDAFVSDLS